MNAAISISPDFPFLQAGVSNIRSRIYSLAKREFLRLCL
jgi:hypothetical protein